MASAPKVLLIGGIWDNDKKLAAIAAALRASGRVPVLHQLVPCNGSAPISELAQQVARAIDSVSPNSKVDILGFSMGALVVRYYIQRLGGRERVRRFISMAGPHSGTHTAWFMSVPGVRDMRPGSALLRDLASDMHPWGDVDVHTILTPFDTMIVPATSSRLAGVKSHTTIPALLHRLLANDTRVIKRVLEILNGD
ncbi:MAG: lipase [Sandaracinaceae bacterium]|nr:lipase [Sandaracinaceae bacterium]